MNKNWSGLFSLGLQSIEWQIKNLFQDSGGEKTVELMDKLAAIPDKERTKLLENFIAQASECIKHTPHKNRLTANSDLQKIEDQIVSDVVSEMNKHSRLSVVNGGKSNPVLSSKLLDFESAKKQRENRFEARAELLHN